MGSLRRPVSDVPIKDPEKRKAANRRYRERVAEKTGRAICPKAGRQPVIQRCPNCPEHGRPCKDCYNAHRRTYRVKAAGYTTTYKPMKNKRPKKSRPFRHRIAVEVKPVKDFLDSELFGCPGCMRKMRGEYRYCERCEAKRNGLP